jgi:hypothetical protein
MRAYYQRLELRRARSLADWFGFPVEKYPQEFAGFLNESMGTPAEYHSRVILLENTSFWWTQTESVNNKLTRMA